MKYIKSIDSSRIFIVYGEDGGADRDGVILLRPGVPDLSLGANYAQVRIAVDNKYFMRGIAVYDDHIVDGYDVVYYTSKPKGTPMEEVFTPLKKKRELVNSACTTCMGMPEPRQTVVAKVCLAQWVVRFFPSSISLHSRDSCRLYPTLLRCGNL